MSMYKATAKSPLFNRFLRSYLMVFILPMTVIVVAMYLTNAHILRREVAQAQMNALLQARRALDYEARRYQTVGAMLANRADLVRLSHVDRDHMTPSDILSLGNLREQILILSASTQGTDQMFLYFAENGYVVESSRALPLEDIHTQLKGIPGTPPDLQTWTALLNTKYTGKWLSIEGTMSKRLCFAQTLPTSYAKSPSTFFVSMKKGYVGQMIQPVNDEYMQCIGVMDLNGDILYESRPIPLEVDMEWFEAESGQRNQDGWIVLHAHSNVTHDVFFSIVSESATFTSLTNAAYVSLAVFLISICVLVLFTYYTTVRNFQPFRQLAVLAASGRNVTGSDEYVQLRVALLEAADEKSQLMQRMERDRRQIEDHKLYHRLCVAEDWAPLREAFSTHGHTVDTFEYYCMIRIEIIDYTGEESPIQQMSDVRDVFDRWAQDEYAVLSIQIGPTLLLLVSMPSGSAVETHGLRRRLTDDTQFIRANYTIDLEMYMSAIHKADRPLGATIQLMEAETHKPESRVTQDEMMPLESDRQLPYMALEMASRQFLTACADGDADTTRRAIHRLTEDLMEIASGMETAIRSADSPEYHIKQMVMQIVSARYDDPMLGVTSIADYLGMSADYVSKVFKQTTLIGLLDYIHHMRVKVAKQLLKDNPDMTIIQIGKRVGYVSADSFIRAFKRIEGITPGRYRENG